MYKRIKEENVSDWKIIHNTNDNITISMKKNLYFRIAFCNFSPKPYSIKKEV
jgi:hypothetical protein